jgi:hypothetical protein
MAEAVVAQTTNKRPPICELTHLLLLMFGVELSRYPPRLMQIRVIFELWGFKP